MITTVRRYLVRSLLRPIAIRVGMHQYAKMAINDLDDKLAKYLNFDAGFFVEIGANDGITQSNTYYLEKVRRWTGILIEPIPSLYNEARKQRNMVTIFNCACVPFDFSNSHIEITDLGLMSFVESALKKPDEIKKHTEEGEFHARRAARKLQVPVKTLTEILESCQVEQIHFFSLDVEGFEADVLRGLDLQRYRPDYLLIEARYREEVEKILDPYYEVLEELTPKDVLYRCRDLTGSKK